MSHDTTPRLAHVIVRLAAALVPAGQRDDWRARMGRRARVAARHPGPLPPAGPPRARRLCRRVLAPPAQHRRLRLDRRRPARAAAAGPARRLCGDGDRHSGPRTRRDGDDVQRHRSDPAAAAPLSGSRSHRDGVGNARAERRAARSVAGQPPRLARARASRSSTSPASIPGRSTSPADPRPEVWFSAQSDTRDSSSRSGSRRSSAASSRPRNIRRARPGARDRRRRSGVSASPAIRRSSGSRSTPTTASSPSSASSPATFEPRAAPDGSGHRRRLAAQGDRTLRAAHSRQRLLGGVGRLKPGVTRRSGAGGDERPSPRSWRRNIRAPTRRPAHACCRCAIISSATCGSRCTLLAGAVVPRAADRVRERRQPAAGARLGARARDRRAHGARRAARPHRPAAAPREPGDRRRSAVWSGAASRHGALTALARLGPATVPWIETLHVDWRALRVRGA